MANLDITTTSTNLGVTTINIPSTGVYSFQGTLALPGAESPAVSQGAGGGAGTGVGGAPRVASQVVVTIRQNGSIIYTSAAGDRGFGINARQCTAGDVMTFTTSSSLSQDQQPQAVKMTIAASQGPV